MLTFTIGNWVGFGVIVVCGIIITIAVVYNSDNQIRNGVIVGIICAAVAIGSLFLMNWYNTSTASGIRAFKDYQSEIDNGIDREITITAEDGREIFHYEGKVDVESNHEDNYIKFESEDGKRYIVYYGIQDTITIIEK